MSKKEYTISEVLKPENEGLVFKEVDCNRRKWIVINDVGTSLMLVDVDSENIDITTDYYLSHIVNMKFYKHNEQKLSIGEILTKNNVGKEYEDEDGFLWVVEDDYLEYENELGHITLVDPVGNRIENNYYVSKILAMKFEEV